MVTDKNGDCQGVIGETSFHEKEKGFSTHHSKFKSDLMYGGPEEPYCHATRKNVKEEVLHA